MKRTVLRLLLGAAVMVGLVGPIIAGPIGPPSGPPYDPTTVILSTNAVQVGKAFALSSATVANLTASTVTVKAITLNGSTFTTPPLSGTSIYPATGTGNFQYGFTAATATITGTLNGSSVTLTGLFTGMTIHGSSAVITGTITGSNLSGTNSGDVSIGTGNGLSISAQVVSMATASTLSTGTLRAVDFSTFNNKLATNGNGSALTGLTKSQVSLGNVLNLDQTDASNLASGQVDPTLLGVNSPTNQTYLRGDSTWQILNSTAAGLGNVTNNRQVKVSDYTQKGGFLIGISTGAFSVEAPGANGTILSADTAQATGVNWIAIPSVVTIYPATTTASFPFGLTASTINISGVSTMHAVNATTGTFTGTLTGSNLTGTNTGDVTLGTANGLSVVGQAISMATASDTTTGSLTSVDWTTFNNKSGVYSATSTIVAPKGINASTGTFSGTVVANGTLTANAGVNMSTATIGSLSGVLKASAGVVSGSATTSDVPEGSNLYYTIARSTTDLTTTPVVISSLTVTSSMTISGPVFFNAINMYGTRTEFSTTTHKGSDTWTGTIIIQSTVSISSASFTGQIQWPDGYIQKNHQFLNLKDPPYSVATNDTGNAATAWTAAMNTITASSVSTTVLLPPGTIRFTTHVSVPMGLVSILGQNTVLDFSSLSSGTTAIFVTGSTANTYFSNPYFNGDKYLSNFTVSGPGYNSGVDAFVLIGNGDPGPSHTKFYNVVVNNMNNGWIMEDHSYLNDWYGCEVWVSSICWNFPTATDAGERQYISGSAGFNSQTGILLDSAITDLYIDGMSLDGMSSNYIVHSQGELIAKDIHYEGNFSPDNSNVHVYYNPSNSSASVYVSLEDSFIDLKSTRAVAAFELDHIGYLNFKDNHINGTGVVSQPVIQTGTGFIGAVDADGNIWTVSDTHYNLQGSVTYWENDRGQNIVTNKNMTLTGSVLSPSTVTFTSGIVTGTKTDSSTTTYTGQQTFNGSTAIKGTVDGSNQSSGYVGNISTANATNVAPYNGSNVWFNISTVTLTAGNYIITGTGQYSSTTSTRNILALSTFPDNTTTDQVSGITQLDAPLPTATISGAQSLIWIFRSTSSFNVYLKGRVTYASGSPTVSGGEMAIRQP